MSKNSCVICWWAKMLLNWSVRPRVRAFWLSKCVLRTRHTRDTNCCVHEERATVPKQTQLHSVTRCIPVSLLSERATTRRFGRLSSTERAVVVIFIDSGDNDRVFERRQATTSTSLMSLHFTDRRPLRRQSHCVADVSDRGAGKRLRSPARLASTLARRTGRHRFTSADRCFVEKTTTTTTGRRRRRAGEGP